MSYGSGDFPRSCQRQLVCEIGPHGHAHQIHSRAVDVQPLDQMSEQFIEKAYVAVFVGGGGVNSACFPIAIDGGGVDEHETL